MPNAKVHMASAVLGLVQDATGVTVRTESGELRADYVIGCDGGRSTVRKALGIEFEGFTWPERFLVITTAFDFEAALGCCYRNYMADPEEWTNLFKVAGDDLKGRWRAVFNTRQDESDEEALSDASVRARLGRIYVPESERDGRRIGARPVAGVDWRAIRRRHIVRIEDVLHPDRHAVEWAGRAFEFRGEESPGPDLCLALRDALAAACEQRLGGERAALDQFRGLLSSQTKSLRHRLSIIAAFACKVETSSSSAPVPSARLLRWRARALGTT